jgi:HD-like signal output (HDOD) protein
MPVTERFLANPAALPVMPEVAQRLIRQLDDERHPVTLRQLADVVGRDQSLAMKVLRLANSSYYSPDHNITRLEDAAAAIGQSALKALALAACLAGAFPPPTVHFDRLRFWRISLVTAGHAQTLAAVCDVEGETAWLGGLLLRTGELLMLTVDPEAVVQAEAASAEPDSLHEHQKALMGCHFAEVSAELAQRWHLPRPLVLALNAFEDPLASRPFSRLGAVLRLASVMAEAGEAGRDPLEAITLLHADLIEYLHLDLDWLRAHVRAHAQLARGMEELLH